MAAAHQRWWLLACLATVSRGQVILDGAPNRKRVQSVPPLRICLRQPTSLAFLTYCCSELLWVPADSTRWVLLPVLLC
jgi:hypothetical protein